MLTKTIPAWLLSLCFVLASNLVWANMLNGEKVEEVEWEQLMPADFSLDELLDITDQMATIDDFDPRAQELFDQMMATMQSAPIVPELKGKMIKIPGYVVPLESEGPNVTTFFLVPYFGACIHVPPPPSNQIVHVHFEPGTHVENLYDAVWVTGRINTETIVNDMATSGYTMEAFQIEPYEL